MVGHPIMEDSIILRLDALMEKFHGNDGSVPRDEDKIYEILSKWERRARGDDAWLDW